MGDLSIVRGDTVLIDLTVTRDGAPVSLSGASLWWTAKRRTSDADAAAVIAKTTAAGITVTDAPGGKARVTITAAETAALTDTLLYWDAQVRETSGTVSTVASGQVAIAPDVTRATA